MEKFITKKELADRAGVHASTVTRFVDANPEVEKKKKIIADHPKVVDFMTKKADGSKTLVSPGGTVIKIDALYDEAATWCATQETWSANKIKKHFSIGTTRATKLCNSLHDAGIRPGVPVPRATESTPAVKKVPAKKPRTPRTRAAAPSAPERYEPPAPTVPEGYDPGLEELPGDIRAIADWPLRKIIARFGTANGFETYLKSLKLMEEITKGRLANHKANGELITKEIVRRNVIEPLDTCFARMLRDGSLGIVSVIINMHKAGDTFEECVEEAKKQLGAFVKPVKKKLKGALDG